MYAGNIDDADAKHLPHWSKPSIREQRRKPLRVTKTAVGMRTCESVQIDQSLQNTTLPWRGENERSCSISLQKDVKLNMPLPDPHILLRAALCQDSNHQLLIISAHLAFDSANEVFLVAMSIGSFDLVLRGWVPVIPDDAID